MRVIHITAHLGGGVGRVLSRLAEHNRQTSNSITDVFLCLEAPKDLRFADAIRNCGAEILIAPDDAKLCRQISSADIVQLEWWHNPLMAKKLAALEGIPARWIVWAHTLGLHYPFIPKTFAEFPYAFIATSPATLPLLKSYQTGQGPMTSYVASTGGFDDFPLPQPKQSKQVRCGYLGTLNTAKLHPDIFSFIDALGRKDLTFDFYGQTGVNPELESAIAARGTACPIKLRGFSPTPHDILPNLDLFIYLLNPTHYGSTENALLEAMACGAVPIVLNNPAEAAIIQDGVTGFIVKDKQDFAAVITRLLDDVALRLKVSQQAAQTVRRDYAVSHSASQLDKIYRAALATEKKPGTFAAVFGQAPSDIFLSCLGVYATCFTAPNTPAQRQRRLALPFLYENTKSSIFQFLEVFPEDARLSQWAKMLKEDQQEQHTLFGC